MSSTASQLRYLGREDKPDIEIARTAGSYVFDTKGKKYLDFLTGWCVGNLGWGLPEVTRAVERFRGPEYVYPGHGYKAWGELAELLVSIAPGNLAKCFRATGGSEAVDLALQAAMIKTGRRGFLSLEDSYHGNTLGAMSIAGSENRETIPSLLPNCHKFEPPLNDRALRKIETILKSREIAAVVMEPISINLGVLIPEMTFMTRLRNLCRRYGTLFIADEVASGFGRTGKLFASEYFELEPDMMCVAKALSGGAAGIGALLTTKEVADAFQEDGNFYSTYGWHPRSTAAAIATVRYIKRHKATLLRNVQRVSDCSVERLSAMSFKEQPKICIKGLAIGLEFEDSGYAPRIADKCRRNGLLMSAEDESILMLPPLNITLADAARGLDIFERAL